jgi:hypothetical protein
MAIGRLRGDQPAPLAAVAQRRMAGLRLSWLARNARQRRGRKSTGPPLREGDRGAADPRPDQPIRGSVGAPRGQTMRRLDDDRALRTRGRKRRARNQVRLRVNGGKTADEIRDKLQSHCHAAALVRPRRDEASGGDIRRIASACGNDSHGLAWWAVEATVGGHFGSRCPAAMSGDQAQATAAGHIGACPPTSSRASCSIQIRPALQGASRLP